MENLSPIQKLDFVFNYIKSHNQQQITSAKTIAFWVNPKGEEIVTPEEALIIIRKLIKDGYVDEFPSSHIMLGDLEIKISFKGLLFHGYEEQERIETQQQFIADQNEKRINRNERLLVNGTWFAGLAALFLLLWQIFLWINPIYSDFPYVIFGIVRKAMH